MRTALGASRGRILTQVFAESMVMAVMATGAGLLILDWLPGGLLTAMGITLPYWIDTGLNAATIALADWLWPPAAPSSRASCPPPA